MNHVDRHHTKHSEGFTLIELLLAMTFIAVLLLSIALTIIQVANIYNRGLLLKELNQTSRTISQELDLALRSSGTFSIDSADNRYVSNAWGGRMCMGQYSYIWNYGKALSDVDSNRNQYSSPNTSGNKVVDASGATRYEITFVKAPDAGGAYCVKNASGAYPRIDPVGAVEMMRTGDHSLAIHKLTVNSATTATDALSAQQVYKISYTLGTTNINALVSDQSACKTPNLPGADLNYCSVQQFTIVLRAVSGVN